MPFAVPMVWREQSDHVPDCYFSMASIKEFSRKIKSKMSYPVRRSAVKPVPLGPDLPVPQPPTEKEDIVFLDESASTGTKSEEDFIESDASF